MLNEHKRISRKGYSWVHATSSSAYQPNAVLAGNDVDGAQIYVGRSYHEGDLLPAKVIPSKNVAYVSHGGNEISKHQFEVSTLQLVCLSIHFISSRQYFRFFAALDSNGLPVPMVMYLKALYVPEIKVMVSLYLSVVQTTKAVLFQAKFCDLIIACISHLLVLSIQ